jgi:hypothetical protein
MKMTRITDKFQIFFEENHDYLINNYIEMNFDDWRDYVRCQYKFYKGAIRK